MTIHHAIDEAIRRMNYEDPWFNSRIPQSMINGKSKYMISQITVHNFQTNQLVESNFESVKYFQVSKIQFIHQKKVWSDPGLQFSGMHNPNMISSPGMPTVCLELNSVKIFKVAM